VIAFFTARANVRRDIEKMQAQLDAHQTATEQEGSLTCARAT
jgi:hypothetical protein